MRRQLHHRLGTAVLLAVPLLFASPRPAAAQIPVTDAANLATRLLEYAAQGVSGALQSLEYAEAVQGVIHLGRQIQQLDSTFAHMRDAANGRIGPLTDAFATLSTADASLLLDADFGAWRTRLSGTSNSLAGALEDMDGTSLSDFLLTELDNADVVTDALLLNLYPSDPNRGAQLADAFLEGRARGDRIRVADLATAEAAGRLFTLLGDAQSDIDGRRSQAELSHTALQQAQIANQLTAAEIDFALAQLHAIQAQQDALARHEAELAGRQRLERWFQREQDRAAQLQQFLLVEQSRRTAARQWGRLHAN